MDEFLTLTRAATALGVSRWTVMRRVQDGSLPVYQSDRDRRTRLVKKADLEALMAPRRRSAVKGEHDGTE